MNIKNNQKGFVAQGMVIIIAIAVIAGVAYYFGTKNVVAPKGGDVVVNATSTVTGSKCANGATNYPDCNGDLSQSSIWKKYQDTSISFEYPALVSVKKDGETISLSHSIAYKHPNPCDFKGDSSPLDRLSDFGVSLKIVNQNLKVFVQSSAYPDWNYVSQNPFKFGSLNGYKIASGVEGCGEDIYYITISSNQTLVIHRAYITEFNSIIGNNNMYLSLPGIISPDKNDEYFNHILSTLKFTSTPTTQPSLTVLSPNGNENWVKGSTKTIRWSNPSTQTVSGVGGPRDEIAIFINSQPTDTAPLLKTVVTGLNKNATSYDWVVGTNAENTVLNGRYYIKVCRQSFTCDWSDAPFTITN